MKYVRLAAPAVLFAGVVASAAHAQAKRPMTFADIMDIKGIGGVALSPDAEKRKDIGALNGMIGEHRYVQFAFDFRPADAG